MGDSKETVLSEHKGTDAYMNLIRLWQHAQDPYRFKTDGDLELREVVETGSHP